MTGTVTGAENGAGKWIRRFGRSGAAGSARLLCFHYAGGSAAMFRDWPAMLPPRVGVLGVQLPGRASRLAEPPYTAMEPLAGDVAGVLAGLLDRRYAFFGFSMGARVALAVAHVLRERGLPGPDALYVASSCAPSLRLPVPGWNESDEALVGYLRRLGGTPPEIFDSPELLQMYLPATRADLTVVGTCPARLGQPLATPIGAFAGAADEQAPPARMLGWRQETTARFDMHVVSGGHFFDAAGTSAMLRLITQDLEGRNW